MSVESIGRRGGPEPFRNALEIIEDYAMLLREAARLVSDFDDPLEVAVHLNMAADGVDAHEARRQLEFDAAQLGMTTRDFAARYAAAV